MTFFEPDSVVPQANSTADVNQRARVLAHVHQAMSELPQTILDLASIFARNGSELALVGGPVRDAFLNRPIHDFDFTTSALPDETIRLLNIWADAVWDIGKKFGTIGAEKNGLKVEVTTYRSEKYDPTSRKPDVQYGDHLEGDLTRRDFTVNAMAVRLPSLELVDPCGGLDDLIAGVLRTPSAATQSFSDDPLRIMRAARFAAQLSFDVTEEVLAAMEALADRLKIVSAERVQAELVRLITASQPRRGIELLVYTGVADIVLPEVAALRDLVDEHRRHKDVYEHTLTVLDHAIALETGDDGPVPRPDFLLRFAALMHDVGKPATRKFERNGTVSFHNHDLVGAKLTAKRMKALRFDKQSVKDVSRLVALHLRFHGYGEQAWTDSAVRRYVADAGDLYERLNRLTRADSTTQNRRKAQWLQAAMDDLEQRVKALKEKEKIDAIRPEIDGTEIMDILQLRPGPDVGKARAFMLSLRIEEGILGKEEATRRLRQWWSEQGEQSK